MKISIKYIFYSDNHMNSKDKNQNTATRLDKWLWAARFYKTRSIAREMIDGGKVYYNGQRTKPSKIIEIGAAIQLRQGQDVKVVIIKSISKQRKGASEAALLYCETQESIKARETKALELKMQPNIQAFAKRPDKKQRRDIMKFKQRNN